MTNKQIMIDGVNVAERVYREEEKCILKDDECCFFPNCDHKQLKRKEQECEELKDKLNCCFCNPQVELNDTEKLQKCLEVTECFRRQLDQLKKENEKLRKEVQSLKLETGRVCE